MKKFTLNKEQLISVFNAGIERGEDQASSYEWGCCPHGKKLDNLVDAIYDIVNTGKTWDDPKYVARETVEDWFKELD